ncbi:MAG: hypothetical protein ACUVRO_03295 [Armatimonadota bacterium]
MSREENPGVMEVQSQMEAGLLPLEPPYPGLTNVEWEDARAFLLDEAGGLVRRQDAVGVLARRWLCSKNANEDDPAFRAVVEEARELQDPAGFWDAPSARNRAEVRATATGRWLRLLADLGVPLDNASVQRAVSWVMSRPDPLARRRVRHWRVRKNAVWGWDCSALYALVRLGVRHPGVERALDYIEGHPTLWIGGPEDCHFGHLAPLVAGGRVDTQAVSEALEWMRQNQASDGFWPESSAMWALTVLLDLPADVRSPLFRRTFLATARAVARDQAWPDRLRPRHPLPLPYESREYPRLLFLRCILETGPAASQQGGTPSIA